MRIGITYDLRADYLAEGYGELETAEFDRAETIDAIAAALEELGHEVDRIGRAKALMARLTQGDRWDLVFNICEGLRGLARESQVPAILDIYEIPYTFSDPFVMCLCLHKELTKTVVEKAGVPTPASYLVQQIGDLAKIRLEFPLFAKPVAEGTGKGVTPASRVDNFTQLAAVCQSLLEEFRQPVLVERFVSGREFTVGLIGTGDEARVLGTLEIVLLPQAEQAVYSYANKENSEELVEYRLVNSSDSEVQRAEEIALQAWRALNCRDAGRIDLRSDGAGNPHFLEANPLAGLHPSHSDLPMLATALGIPYTLLIQKIVHSASERILS